MNESIVTGSSGGVLVTVTENVLGDGGVVPGFTGNREAVVVSAR